MIEIDGQSYDAMIGSDLDRDGMYLEVQDAAKELVAEVFYSDVDGKMTLTSHRGELPLPLIEWMIAYAKERLVPTGKSND